MAKVVIQFRRINYLINYFSTIGYLKENKIGTPNPTQKNSRLTEDVIKEIESLKKKSKRLLQTQEYKI